MQLYIENRFAGAAGPDWLDGQRTDQAAKACEMIGACREYGAHCNLDALTMAQWDRAGAVGFEAAAMGPDGIRGALEEIRSSSGKGTRASGPQAAYGRLFQWLQFNKSSKDRGPILGVVRDHILDTMVVEPGTQLFGEAVSERRRHSIASLAKASGIHYRTLERAVVRGRASGGETGRPHRRVGEHVAFLTGARLQYGNLGHFKEARCGHAILLYRAATGGAVLAT